MLQSISHPRSRAVIQGTKLSAGATLAESDLYDSSSGRWSPVPSALVGMTLKKGHAAIFVRPDAQLSEEAGTLLAHLVKYDFYLTERHWWIVIPDVASKYDDRMDWRVLCPERIPELIAFGYIEPHPDDETVYQPTPAGRLIVGQKN